MQQNEAENMYSENQVFNPQDTPVKAVNDAYLLLQNYLNNYCGGLQAYALTSVFYIDPLHKKMYYIHSDIHTTIDLSIFNYLFTSNIYCVNENYIKEIYDALFNLLIEQAKINPVLPLYNRFVHVHKKFFFSNISSNKFLIKKDGIISVNASFYLSRQGTPLTKSVLTHFFEATLSYTYNQRQIYKIWSSLKRYKCIPVLPDKMYQDRLYDADGNYVICKSGKILHEKSTYDDYNFNRLPSDFLYENYYFSEAILNALYNITNNKISAFKHLACLVASAYSSSALLKSATIIVTNKANHDAVMFLLDKLFYSKNVTLLKEHYTKPTLFYEEYINHNFINTPVFMVQEDLPDNCDNLRNLVSAKTFRLKIKDYGDICFKNKIPFLLVTSDEAFAQKFAIQVNSNIIRTNEEIPIDLNKISESDIRTLRQSLAINGLRLFSQPTSKKTYKNTTISDKKIIDNFISNYCCFGNYITSKQSVKDAFRQYLHAFYQHHKLSPLALCNSLRNMGFSINSKKRINGIKNPIAVICGMTINTNKLIYNIEHYARNNEIEPEEDSSDIEYFLYNSTISNNEDY